MTDHPRILVIDDDEAVLYSFKRMMASEPFTLETGTSGRECLEKLSEDPPAVVVMDIRLGGEMDGTEVLRRIRADEMRLPVILMTAYASAGSAIEATRHGAYEYILKPFDPEEMKAVIRRACEAHKVMARNVVMATEAKSEVAESDDCIIGLSASMQEVYKRVGRAASTKEPVLIRGASGTGKELVARAIYQYSDRKNQIFLPVNCGALPQHLIESEMFGHEKGAFTGAVERRLGKFEQADGGTVFLDEIGEMPLDTQVRFLRFLEDQIITRVGGAEQIRLNVRILAATNRPLEEMVRAGTFREDLYYRLNVLTIALPSLAERRDDIPELVRYFIRKHTPGDPQHAPAVQPEALELLANEPWAGNVRELENTLRRVLVEQRGGVITCDDINNCLQASLAGQSSSPAGPPDREQLPVLLKTELSRRLSQLQKSKECDPLMPELETLLVNTALELTSGNQVQAAKLLGISRNTLRKRIQEQSAED